MPRESYQIVLRIVGITLRDTQDCRILEENLTTSKNVYIIKKIYKRDLVSRVTIETQRSEGAFSSFEAIYLTEKRLNSINPSLLMNLVLALELQKTLSGFQTEVDFF